MIADIIFRVNVFIFSRLYVEDRLCKIKQANIEIDHQPVMR